MTYLLVRHLYPLEQNTARHLPGREKEAEAIIAAIKASYRDVVAWFALADLCEECGYRGLYDLRCRIDECIVG